MQRRQGKSRVCPTCGIEYRAFPRGPRGYCSDACRYIEIACSHCGIMIKRPRWNGGAEQPFCSHACRLSAAKATQVPFVCEQCGKESLRQPNLTYKRFCSLACKRRFQGESSLERLIREELQRLGVAFEREVKVGRYSVDFVVEGRIAIEADGDYWHSAKVARRDDSKLRTLQEHGYTLVRLHEDVKNDVGAVWSSLKEFDVQRDVATYEAEIPARLTRSAASRRTHGHTNNRSRTPEFIAWMYLRRHASIGIPVQTSLVESLNALLDVVGPAPAHGYVIGRIDYMQSFEPGNIRWVTSRESFIQLQAMHRLNNSVTQSLRQKAAEFNVSLTTIYRWRRQGKLVE